jgi:hypothetical protein
MPDAGASGLTRLRQMRHIRRTSPVSVLWKLVCTPHQYVGARGATRDCQLLSKARERENFAQEANSSTFSAAMILDGLSNGRQTCIAKIGEQHQRVVFIRTIEWE